jgi:hypothetical protein
MKRILIAALLPLLLAGPGKAELSSLSQLYSQGKTVQDLDGDGQVEKIAISVIIPDNASAAEIALASDVAARVNLESLAQDFTLVLRESEVTNWDSLPNPVLIGSNLRWVRDIVKDRKPDVAGLGPDRGLVFVFSHKGQRGIACVAGSDDALLRTGRAFFLRWPYFWEVWGRETGATFLSFENDLAAFLVQEDVQLLKTAVREAAYEFPPRAGVKGALKSLDFSSGEIRELVVELHFTDEDDQEKAYRALDILARQRPKGLRTEVLSYPACALISFELMYGKKKLQVGLPRPGSTRRLLTPAFKEEPKPEPGPRDFDLLDLFTTKGLYADRDGDGILDGLDSAVVIPAVLAGKGVAGLAAKLVLPTAGASFPIVFLDSEIDRPKGLTAPVLVGENRLTLDLVRTGKLLLPDLESARGLVRVVPKAFNDTGALVVHAADTPGLEKLLTYLAETFPYFDEYREGRPRLRDVPADLAAFLKGEKGGAEAFFAARLKGLAAELAGIDLESVAVRLTLPKANPAFEEAVRKDIGSLLGPRSLAVETRSLREGKAVFEKEKEFDWEVDESLALLGESLASVGERRPVRVSLGVSESPEVRAKVKERLEGLLAEHGLAGAEVEVASAYKQGFYWLTEKVAPSLKGKAVHRLSVRFRADEDPRSALKRSYAEPYRWLHELYPADEIVARELQIPVERIEFETKPADGPVYEALAFDEKNGLVSHQVFSPRTREMPFLNVLPEWGRVLATTGWLRLEAGKETVLDAALRTDLERFWEFFQEEVLRPVHAHVLRKTGYDPEFAKQPYFKRLLVELWASEPDYRLGIDEEAVSSLESIHDEIYFDTLDLLRGITRFGDGDASLPEDTSRASAPGNVLPVVHPSSEGGKPRVRVSFEDWPAAGPEMEVRWKEPGREEAVRTIAFPALKVANVRVPGFIYDGQEDRMEKLFLELEAGTESEYLGFLDLAESLRSLAERGLTTGPFDYPKLKTVVARIRWKDLVKEESLPVVAAASEARPLPAPPGPEEALVRTDEILSPEAASDVIGRLGTLSAVRAYTGGRSYEDRPVPVIEIFAPREGIVSIARLVTFKPTLQLSARQHANEISSTNYTLRLAELLARDRAWQDAARRINFVIQPMENPDGAALASELARLAPFHSLHAGRYGSLGVDIGAQVDTGRPVLPEAAVRTELYDKWLPDIYLNLHGYPSHEWVQPFSNYSPYLFRDYRIPRGWFAYFRAPDLAIYEKWKAAGEELLSFITREIQTDERSRESNRRLYDRYGRWASRWQPHLSPLEITDGVNIYAKRRSSRENRLTFRSRLTFVDETPELMDETASGAWLSFLCEQGLAYLKAHVRYLAQVRFATARVEEEVGGRVRIEFHRERPGTMPAAGRAPGD